MSAPAPAGRGVALRLWPALAVLAVLAVAAACVRLGFWQLERLREKQTLNTALRVAQESPVLVTSGPLPPPEHARGRALQVSGRFDERHQFLLSGRTQGGVPGVEVVTPLVLEGGSAAILVNRGWLPAADAVSARPQEYAEPGRRTVRGLVEVLRRGAGGPPPRALEGGDVSVWSLRWLDADSIARRVPYAVAPYALRELPGPGVRERPRRLPPRPYDEMIHVGYAIQWFLFAAILLGGGAALARSRRRRGRVPPAPEVSP